MRARYSLLHILALPLLACGGGGNTTVDSSIHGIDGHGGSGSGSNPGSATCDVGATTTVAFGSAADVAAGTSGLDMSEQFEGRLNQDAKPDLIRVELYAGAGTFGSGNIAPKSITIAGEEANYKTCGACVRIFGNFDPNAGSNVDPTDQTYEATGGTINLTSVTGTFSATLSNVTLTHVTIGSDFTSTPVGDCDTTIASASLSAPIQSGSGSGSAAFTLTGSLDSQVVLRHRTR